MNSETTTTEHIATLIDVVSKVIAVNQEELTLLDQAIGDGDHVSNLQRGLQALSEQAEILSQLDWQTALQRIGMTILSSVGGASGSLYGTLFIAMSKAMQGNSLTLATFPDIFSKGVEAVKLRGKAELGEKTLLDVFIPVSEVLSKNVNRPELFETIKKSAITGAESTRDMIATKGRASFLGERSRGHVDAGAKSSQLMICAIVDQLIAPT